MWGQQTNKNQLAPFIITHMLLPRDGQHANTNVKGQFNLYPHPKPEPQLFGLFLQDDIHKHRRGIKNLCDLVWTVDSTFSTNRLDGEGAEVSWGQLGPNRSITYFYLKSTTCGIFQGLWPPTLISASIWLQCSLTLIANGPETASIKADLQAGTPAYFQHVIHCRLLPIRCFTRCCDYKWARQPTFHRSIPGINSNNFSIWKKLLQKVNMSTTQQVIKPTFIWVWPWTLVVWAPGPPAGLF